MGSYSYGKAGLAGDATMLLAIAYGASSYAELLGSEEVGVGSARCCTGTSGSGLTLAR